MTITARAVAVLFAAGLSVTVPLAQQAQPPSQPPAQPPPTQPPPAQQPPTDPQQQPPTDPQQPPRIRTGINYVRVDVIVTDKDGNPVLDLKPEDFAVSEDGKLQKIDSFAVVKIDPVQQAQERQREVRTLQDEEREASRPDVRLFTILLDDYHVRRGNDMAIRKPLQDFINNQLAPADMVALMYPLTPVTDIRFSRDRDALQGAIDKFEGRKFNYDPRNQFEEQYAFYPAAVVERVRNQVTMDALKAACFQMGALREGRKSVIFVSEGFTSTLPAQLNDPVAALPGLNNPNRNNPNAPQASDTQRLMGQIDMNRDMTEVFDACNRQNTSIYAVDPRGLAVFEYGINEGINLTEDAAGLRDSLDSLHVLASNTDGRAIVNRNDLAVGMKQIMRDSSGYYLLGYNSADAPTDGKFHEIKVNVKRRGLTVRARKGYWAFTAEDAARAAAPPKPEAPSAVRDALAELAAPAGGRPARFWTGTSRGTEGRARVTFVWEAVPPPPGVRRDEAPARVSLTALSADGNPLFRGRVPGPEVSVAAAQPGAASGAATFDAPPGQIQLRIVLEGEKGEVLDSAVRELTVPDFTNVELSLGTPRVYRVRSVRDMQNLKAQADAPPTTDREFSRTERLLVRVEAYAPGGVVPDISARLLNRSGAAMSDLPMQATPAGLAELELPLAALATGEYLIEINAKGPSGTAQEVIAFRVGR
jgi:VWFA-related protein